ncbi:hypothetical protein GCM10009678_22810 [Actinomadura kijaniata]
MQRRVAAWSPAQKGGSAVSRPEAGSPCWSPGDATLDRHGRGMGCWLGGEAGAVSGVGAAVGGYPFSGGAAAGAVAAGRATAGGQEDVLAGA